MQAEAPEGKEYRKQEYWVLLTTSGAMKLIRDASIVSQHS